jgi:hypothetical protein
MRVREGTYRLLPAPAHVVFMRYTGQDGRRDDADGAVVLLSGEITTPGTMCDILGLVAQTTWRGQLVILDGETSRSMFFHQGSIVGVTTSAPDERLGFVLYRYGVLDEEKLDKVMDLVGTGRRLGEAAVELGFLTQEQVYKYIGKQIEEVFIASLTVSDGTFFFLEGFDDASVVSRHMISANALLMEGVTRMDELRYFRERIPSNLHVPTCVEGRPKPGDEFIKTYQAIDGRSNIEDIGRITSLGEFETTRQLYALLQSKHVTMKPPRLTGGPAAIVAVANGALRVVFDRVEAAHKSGDVRTSVAHFAAGAGVYDILFRGAGPNERGELDADRVAENSLLLSTGSDPEPLLRQMLHDYVAFALFSAGAALGTEREAELKRTTSAILDELRPLAAGS